jgi:hypothetical protein
VITAIYQSQQLWGLLAVYQKEKKIERYVGKGFDTASSVFIRMKVEGVIKLIEVDSQKT